MTKVLYTTLPELKNSSYFNKAAILSAKRVMGTKILISGWIYSNLDGIARTYRFNSSYTGTWIIWGNKSQELVELVDHILLSGATFFGEAG